MARMPGATWRPIPASSSRMSSFDIVCIHTMVGSLAGTDSYFRQIAPGINSHFGTGSDGTIWQWVDTTYRSGANYNGNHHVISIENADLGVGFPAWNTADSSQVPAFTEAQVEANARICAWAHQTHGIPLELIPDSKPGRRGIGYHRQGVPGYVVAGGELWSTKAGKVCPGNRRIAQIPQIIARARQIAGGIEEDDMPSVSEFWNAETVHPMTGERLPVIDLVKDAVRWAQRAAVDAAVAKRLGESAAKAGRALSDEEIARIAEATAAEVAEDISAGYDLTATPKPPAA